VNDVTITVDRLRGRRAGVGREEPKGELVGVYRTWLRNMTLAAGLIGLAVCGCTEFTGPTGGGLFWSRRVPIAVVVATVLVVRVLRRAVIVSPHGIEARRTLFTWRVPWSAVESFAVGHEPSHSEHEGPLTVVLLDGSSRRAHVGAGRPGRPSFADVAAVAREHPRSRSRAYLEANVPLGVFIVAGITLIVACAIVDTGRANHRAFEAGEVAYTAKELDDLKLEIAVAGAASVALYVTLVVAGITALVWSRRSRGVAPTGPWPASLRFPDDDEPGSEPSSPSAAGGGPVRSLPAPHPSPVRGHRFEIPPLVICQGDGVLSADGKLLAAISHREVAWTPTEAYTYWSARGVAAFTVQIQTPTALAGPGGALAVGARWLMTSWDSPLPDHFEVAGPIAAALLLHPAGATPARLVVADRSSDKGLRYTAIDDHQTLATIERRSNGGWECRMYTDLPPTTRRLLCVASLWAERRHISLRSSD
jgi:hypothetical protein